MSEKRAFHCQFFQDGILLLATTEKADRAIEALELAAKRHFTLAEYVVTRVEVHELRLEP
jgi:hypothetical protein